MSPLSTHLPLMVGSAPPTDNFFPSPGPRPTVFVVSHALPLSVHYESGVPVLIPVPEENDALVGSLYRTRKDLSSHYNLVFVGAPKIYAPVSSSTSPDGGTSTGARSPGSSSRVDHNSGGGTRSPAAAHSLPMGGASSTTGKRQLVELFAAHDCIAVFIDEDTWEKYQVGWRSSSTRIHGRSIR